MIFDLSTKGFQTISTHPDSNWTDDESLLVIPDGSELAGKIISNYPYFDCVMENGVLVDVIPTEPLPEPTVTQPTELERLAARVDYISLMTGVDV